MSKLRVQSFAVSIDGYGAGPNQDLQNPLGVRGPELMEWFFPTRAWQTDARPGRRRDRGRQRHRGAGLCRNRRLDSRPQHVRSRPGPVARRQLEGLVGRRAAVSHARLRADASPARAAQDGGRHGVSLRHRRHPRRAGAGEGCRRRPRRAPRRRRRHDPAVSARGPDRRAASRDLGPSCSVPGSISWSGIDMRALGYECAKYVAGERATHVFLRRRA